MDRIVETLIDTARQSPSIFTHAAILMRNKKPLRYTAAFNIGTDHAEMRSCSKYMKQYDKGLRQKC